MVLGDICEVYSGYALKKFNDILEGIPVIKIGNISGDGLLILNECQYTKEDVSEKYYSQYGDVYIALSGATIGKTGMMNLHDRYIINQRVGIIRRKENKVPAGFLKYFLLRQTNRMLQEATGCAQPNISPKQIKQYKVPLLNTKEMLEITDIFDKITNIIEKSRMELDKLDELIKARFVEMFGDPLDKSKANKYFTDCVEFNPKKSEIKDSMEKIASFVPMECIGVDGTFMTKEEGLVKEYYKGYTYFRNGDVLLAKITPCFENGKIAIAENCTNGIGFGTTEFHVSRPIEGTSNSYWIKYMLKNDKVHNLASINMTGSAGQKRIQTSFFKKLRIYLPSMELQDEFADFVKQVDKSKVVEQKVFFI